MALPPVERSELVPLAEALPASDWEALAGQHLFVAGGTGFLGCWLLELLLHANDRFRLGLRLTVLSRQPDRFRTKAPHLATHSAVTLLAGDIRDAISLAVRCDFVIHAAADVEQPDADAVHAFDAIVQATRGALGLASRSGARRVLHVSSGAVYGQQPLDVARLAESHPFAPDRGDPRAAYALGKRVSEWLADQAARTAGFQVVHARLFAIVGAYIPLHAHFAAGNFLADAALGRAIRVAGTGAPLRSYLHAGDAAAWLLAMLVRGSPGTAYNVGAEEAISIRDLAHEVAALAGVGVEVADPTPSGALPPRYVPDTSLARGSLGLRRYTAFPAALEHSLRWVRRLPPAQLDGRG